jgi:hypothetical protein
MPCAAHDGFVQIKVAVPDLDIVATVGVGANPGLVVYRRPLTAKVRKGNQHSYVTLLATGEFIVLQEPPPILLLKVVYTKDERLAIHAAHCGRAIASIIVILFTNL